MHNGVLDALMIFFSSLGDKGVVWIIAALALIATKKYRKYGICLAVALLLDLLIVDVTLKPLIARARPFVGRDIDLIVHIPDRFSFPSGHTASSFAAATVLLKADKRFGIIAIILACLIAFSRMYLYMHFPTDILGGIFVGILCGALALVICNCGSKLIDKRFINHSK